MLGTITCATVLLILLSSLVWNSLIIVLYIYLINVICQHVIKILIKQCSANSRHWSTVSLISRKSGTPGLCYYYSQLTTMIRNITSSTITQLKILHFLFHFYFHQRQKLHQAENRQTFYSAYYETPSDTLASLASVETFLGK